MMAQIKVLIVEDSKLMQQLITKMLKSDPAIRVIGAVSDPLLARDLIKKNNPDVITLDIMLPYMDGITFLKNIMRLHPVPVVMISALTEEGSSIALEALSIGAIDYLPKPTQKEIADLNKYEKELTTVVKNAAKANVQKKAQSIFLQNKIDKLVYKSKFLRKQIIAIGASTGGIEAIESILMRLPQILPPIIIVQHLKKEFSLSFSKRIHKLYGLAVVLAETNMEAKPAHIYIAPGDQHLTIKKSGDHYTFVLNDSPPVNGHRPSIDVLFHSMAEVAGSYGIGILLTGMGRDGANGLKEILDHGGATIVQDRESSLIWGMPGVAVKVHAAEYIEPINNIAQKILQILDAKALELKPNEKAINKHPKRSI